MGQSRGLPICLLAHTAVVGPSAHPPLCSRVPGGPSKTHPPTHPRPPANPRTPAPCAPSAGWARALITQNVDRLHHKAGSPQVVELHGTTHRVVCMGCGRQSCREELQRTLAELNLAAQRRTILQWLQDNGGEDRLARDWSQVCA